MNIKKVIALVMLCIILFTMTGCGECKHKTTAWEVGKVDNIKATKTMNLVCSNCGETLETKEEEIETFIDGKVFTLTPKEFVERLKREWGRQRDLALVFKYAVNSDGYLNFDIYNKNDAWLGWGLFYDEDLNAIEATNADVPMASVRINIGPIDDIDVDTLIGFFTEFFGPCSCAIDPSIKDGEMYSDPISENLYAYRDGKPLNGLYYTCQYDEEIGKVYLDIDIAS